MKCWSPCVESQRPHFGMKNLLRLCTSTPSTTHLRAYIAGRNGQPTGTQSMTPDREEVPQSLPSNATQMGGPHANSTWTLGMPN